MFPNRLFIYYNIQGTWEQVIQMPILWSLKHVPKSWEQVQLGTSKKRFQMPILWALNMFREIWEHVYVPKSWEHQSFDFK